MNVLKFFIKYLFFSSYGRLMTREKTYAQLPLRLVLATDKLLKFKFLSEFARRQHDAFGFDDEEQIVALIGSNVIDIGSGMGYWGLRLMSSGREIVAIDLSMPYIRFTKMLGVYSAVIRASADALPIRSDFFDTALALEIIEHINKQSGYSLIRETKRVSSCVIMSTPQNPLHNFDLPKWVPETEQHLSSWTEKDFRMEGFTTSSIGASTLAVHVENRKKRQP
jgi:2-polyprenyl-3-methyl-5-hydroxy-6-metoxy-1,4-benzoquinol methylase